MSSNGADIAVAGLLLIRILEDIEKDERRLQRKRRYWTNPLHSKRQMFDIETNLLSDLLYEDSRNHTNFLRLPYENFCEIHELVHPIISGEDTAMRISSKVRLAVTLRLLVTGDNFRFLGYLARISPSTISLFVPKVLKAIYQCLQPKFLKFPQNQEEWEAISMDFEKLWHFPHTLGALDGKHVRIKQPNCSVSRFYNYKGFHSVIVLALVDAHCKFIYIDVGSNGRSSGGGVFSSSSLLNYMKSSKCCFPSPKPLLGQTSPIPYYIVADDNFALDKTLMIPYSRFEQLSTFQEVFNYRLCRARLTVEAAFGRMASRFRILHRPIETKLDTVDWIIKCCCVLHNYLTIPEENTQAPKNLRPDKLPETITNIPTQNISSRYKTANKIRDEIALYCTKAGNVPFQWEKIKIKSFN